MISIEDLRGAVARGWCRAENSHKEMDATLAEAIVTEAHAALDAESQKPTTNSASTPCYSFSKGKPCQLMVMDMCSVRPCQVMAQRT